MASREELRRKLKEYDNHTYKDTLAYKAQINKIKSMDDGSAKDKEITYLKEDLIPFLKLSIKTLRASLINSVRSPSRSRSRPRSKPRSKSATENMDVEKTRETDAAEILISMSKGTNPKTPIETNPSESPKSKKTRWAGGYRKRTSKSIHSKINKYVKLFSV
jgi:hypothetical protein